MEVYGTFLDGTSLYGSELSASGVIVMGNEGKGISDEVAQTVSRRLLIPTYPADAVSAESLNVATATAITVAEFRRQTLSSK
jgi:TrmH family RNA methyltransferase